MFPDGDTEAGRECRSPEVMLPLTCNEFGLRAAVGPDRLALGLPPSRWLKPPWGSPTTNESDTGTFCKPSRAHRPHLPRLPLWPTAQRSGGEGPPNTAHGWGRRHTAGAEAETAPAPAHLAAWGTSGPWALPSLVSGPLSEELPDLLDGPGVGVCGGGKGRNSLSIGCLLVSCWGPPLGFSAPRAWLVWGEEEEVCLCPVPYWQDLCLGPD